jgi:hypothetical protein
LAEGKVAAVAPTSAMNNEPQPFVWKATADVILDKVRRCKEASANN